ncbi:uncharacterized protein MELLADRAFT_96061 [Melampsora larici-populina 98AG31]|uniref:Uncharacterized protein n=1 Tax=Melampsora larici-populina (strain 98AG31 / pathotype 3-4-7) TaxID=747676 RepID=F4SAT8_MELLP|nr:uncharacterized protein MELLADRAFT_96061 [Melampsora larici-populina 98AG31]EGF98222.1 hypothetical protein MELLADRAFT_96061 [Melampsora larici-populina 98AG31]
MVQITRSGAQQPSPTNQSLSNMSKDARQSTTSQSKKKSNKRPAPAKSTRDKSKRIRAVVDPEPINTQTATIDTDDDNMDDDDYTPSDRLDDINDDDINDEMDDPFSLPPPLPPRPDLEQTQPSSGTLPPPPLQNPRTNVSDSDSSLPTISTYQQVAKQWPQTRISNYTRGKKLDNVVPEKILVEMQAIQELYHHHKKMLAMMGNISLYTLNKAIGEVGRKRKQDGLHLWLSYGIDALNYKMPRSSEIGALGQRNKDLSTMWKAYPVERQEVFQPHIFYYLSGLPQPPRKSDDKADHDEEELIQSLSPEERKELQTLYDEMVCVEKVATVYAKVAAGNPIGNSLPEFNRKSLKCVKQLHDQIHNESNNMWFAYYFIAAATHAASDGKLAEPGWCKEYTSHKEMANYVVNKANFPRMFATHVQGLAVTEVVSQQNGKGTKAATKTITPTDCVKGELSAGLRQELNQQNDYLMLVLLRDFLVAQPSRSSKKKVSSVQDCSASWVKAYA